MMPRGSYLAFFLLLLFYSFLSLFTPLNFVFLFFLSPLLRLHTLFYLLYFFGLAWSLRGICGGRNGETDRQDQC
ncbi:hypothetical protein BDZ91DRAFT_304129 [Kalaharituber pfeilii]|nr:hypothetical protein BDZ91DRAFT_304129 [Kalaharituber pfeilii]